MYFGGYSKSTQREQERYRLLGMCARFTNARAGWLQSESVHVDWQREILQRPFEQMADLLQGNRTAIIFRPTGLRVCGLYYRAFIYGGCDRRTMGSSANRRSKSAVHITPAAAVRALPVPREEHLGVRRFRKALVFFEQGGLLRDYPPPHAAVFDAARSLRSIDPALIFPGTPLTAHGRCRISSAEFPQSWIAPTTFDSGVVVAGCARIINFEGASKRSRARKAGEGLETPRVLSTTISGQGLEIMRIGGERTTRVVEAGTGSHRPRAHSSAERFKFRGQ